MTHMEPNQHIKLEPETNAVFENGLVREKSPESNNSHRIF